MRKQENFFIYLKWRGDLSFAASKVNAVDALILAELVYVDFGRIVPGIGEAGSVSLSDAAQMYDKRFFDLGNMNEETPDEELLHALAETKRFGNLRLSQYVDDTDEAADKQFAAMQIEITDRERFIVYRGTNGTLVGWKENFNMAYLLPGPGQRQAVEYLNTVGNGSGSVGAYLSETIPDGRDVKDGGENIEYYICGHSKGGNLAAYAAICCEPGLQKCIRRLYMFDAPGFLRPVWRDETFQHISDRVESYVPESSIVGALLNYYPIYRVVASSETGTAQHIPFSWLIDGPDFAYVDKRDRASNVLEQNIHDWLERIPMVERKGFVDALFEVLADIGFERFSDLKEMNLTKLGSILRAVTSISQENRETFLRILRMVRGEG